MKKIVLCLIIGLLLASPLAYKAYQDYQKVESVKATISQTTNVVREAKAATEVVKEVKKEVKKEIKKAPKKTLRERLGLKKKASSPKAKLIDLSSCEEATSAVKTYGKKAVYQSARKAGWSDEQIATQAKKCEII